MREAPRQPPGLDQDDREVLAIMGHRIERWDVLLDRTLTFEQRRDKLNADLQSEIRMLSEKEESDDDESAAVEVDELIDDIRLLYSLDGGEEGVREFYKDRTEYYRAVREEFLKSL